MQCAEGQTHSCVRTPRVFSPARGARGGGAAKPNATRGRRRQEGIGSHEKLVLTHSFTLSYPFERALPPATVDRVVAISAHTQQRYSAR
eukprot:3452127-Pleurochrysis_carterae.AAC.1